MTMKSLYFKGTFVSTETWVVVFFFQLLVCFLLSLFGIKRSLQWDLFGRLSQSIFPSCRIFLISRSSTIRSFTTHWRSTMHKVLYMLLLMWLGFVIVLPTYFAADLIQLVSLNSSILMLLLFHLSVHNCTC